MADGNDRPTTGPQESARIRSPESTRDDGAVVVSLAGELDLYNAHEVRDALLAVLRRAPDRLVVDLERGQVHRLDRARRADRGAHDACRTVAASCSPRPASRRAARSRSRASTATSRCTNRSTAARAASV